MRSTFTFLFALLLSACGGGSPTDSPPVPVAPVPAVVTVTAGDGQQAVPGATLPVKPVVTVKDAAGRPTSGVTVTFAVDSGGGTLQAGTATTATDGTASPGDWKLGPNEARNVLRVTAGSLAAVRLVALGALAPVTIADQTVSSGGGTIAVTTAGSPINGLKIVVPAGAFPSGQTVGITYGSNLGTELPQGAIAISPLLTFRVSDGGWAPTPLFITIPAITPPGMRPTIVLRDPATGRQVPLTTIAFTASSVTAVTAHLNGALLMARDGGAGSSRIAARSASTLVSTPIVVSTAVVIALPESLLGMDHDTGFRPGIDNWEFRPIGTIATQNIAASMVATEAWYYVSQKRAGGPLWKKYQEADGIEESNRRGLRWASAAAVAVRGNNELEFAAIYSTVVLDIATRNPTLSALQVQVLVTRESFNSIRTALTVTPGSPQRAVLLSADTRLAPVPVLVFRSTGDRLFAVDPFNPSAALTLDFPLGLMKSVTISGTPGQYDFIMAEGFSLLADVPVLQSQWASVVDGTIGNDIFPTYQAKMGWGATAAETANLSAPVYVFGNAADPVAVWADCVTCLGGARPANYPPGPAQIARLAAWSRAGATGPWTDLGVGGRALLVNPNNAVGLAVFSHRVGSDVYDWTDWMSFPADKLPATIAPSAPTADPNTDVALTLTVTGAPGNLEYVWDFADATPLTTTTLPSVTHKWATSGTYVTKVTARDKTTKQPIAKATVTVSIGGSIYTAWKITTKATTLINDTRLVDTTTAAQGNLWLNAVLAHGVTSNYNFLWKAYQADSSFLYGAQSTNAAIALIARDTLLGAPFAPTTGFHRGIYWWTYGSYPTAATTPLSPGIIGSSNNLNRGGISCIPAYQARFAQTGSTTSGRVTGLNWVTSSSNEPLVMFEYDVTFSGDTATGTTTKTYRLNDRCSKPEVTWSYRTSFTAQ